MTTNQKFFAILSLMVAQIGCGAPTQINSLKAVVNGEPITQVEVDEAVRTQVQMYLMENKGMVTATQAERDISKMEQNALNDLIDRKLILSEFKTMGGKIDDKYIDQSVDRFVQSRFEGDRDKFLQQLGKQGITLNQFREIQRDQIAVQALRAKHTERDKGAGMLSLPVERKEVYDEIKHEFASEGKLKLRMLSIPKITPEKGLSEQEALIKSFRSQILKGASFEKMATEHSRDSFQEKGGLVGVIDRSTLNQRLTQIAYSLPVGQVSEVIDDGPSWRLMYIDGKVGQKVPSQKEIEDEVEKRLAIKKRQANMDGWLAKLRRDSNVRIFE
jgi:SurA N-terminal domain/PPIC-type PPIASE domain